MKCVFPEISWHNRDPVLSLDIHPETSDFYRLATGGADCHVLIWQLRVQSSGAVNVEFVSDLTRHQRAVNVVRWSPCGLYLASGDDDSNIILWQRKTDNIPLLEGDTGDKEVWIVLKVLRGHKEDVYDICWSPDSSKLVTGSIDNTAIIWDFMKGKSDFIITDHKGFVQGVTWDPKGDYIATISSDRVFRIFPNTGKQVKARVYKGLLPVPASHSAHNKEVKFFHDDTFKSYFRRLQFSPDGSLVAVPSGCIDTDDCDKVLNAAYVFTLDSLESPAAVYPTGKQCTIAVRFCPVLFELRPNGPDSLIDLPYRMIFAIATDSDLILYDTQQPVPFAYIQKIHYTRLTDVSWSSDGLLLAVCSTDGFCTFVTFEPEQLGTVYVREESELEDSLLDVSGCEELPKEEAVEVKVKAKRPNLLEQWTIKTPKKLKVEGGEGGTNLNKNKKLPETEEPQNSQNSDKQTAPIKETPNAQSTKDPHVNRIIPKRITPRKIPTVGQKSKPSGPHCSTPKNKRKISRESQASPLLSFLKTSTPTKNPIDKGVISVSLDDDEAQDAFPSKNISDAEKREEGIVQIDLTEELEDDFKLEYSNLTCTENSSKKANESSKNEESAVENQSATLADNNGDVTGTITADADKKHDMESPAGVKLDKENLLGDKKVQIESESVKEPAKIAEKGETGEAKASPQIKIKKRIPLITLSSPKSKKK